MGALRTWLGDVALKHFTAAYLGRQPFAAPDVARPAAEQCTWSTLDELLASPHADTLVVSHGEALALPAPCSRAALDQLFACGIGVAVRRAERASAAVAALAHAVSEDLAGEQRVIVFATPKDSGGFGWHFDEEEVFIVQTAGEKTYYFRANTVSPRPLVAEPAAFGAYRSECSPLYQVRLHAGDWLYLPSGHWHAAYAHEHALSVSIGVLPAKRRA